MILSLIAYKCRSRKKNMKSKFPKGWDEKKVRTVPAHYEKQTEEEAAAEDEIAFKNRTETAMEAPDIPELFLRLQSQAKAKQITKDKILKDIRSVRRQLYRETSGDE